MKLKILVLFSFILFISVLTQVSAVTPEEAIAAMNDAQKNIEQMQEFNLSTERVHDLLLSVNATYTNQLS